MIYTANKGFPENVCIVFKYSLTCYPVIIWASNLEHVLMIYTAKKGSTENVCILFKCHLTCYPVIILAANLECVFSMICNANKDSEEVSHLRWFVSLPQPPPPEETMDCWISTERPVKTLMRLRECWARSASSACILVEPIMFVYFASLFNCTTVNRTSELMNNGPFNNLFQNIAVCGRAHCSPTCVFLLFWLQIVTESSAYFIAVLWVAVFEYYVSRMQ